MPPSKNKQEENKLKFHVVRDERFVDLNLYQFGWEKCEPLHQFGPAMRNHFLFHYVLSGKGRLELDYKIYNIEAGQGFLLCPNQISSYFADQEDPWTYTWLEFDGLRARECMTLAGLNEKQPIYTPIKTGANNLEQLFANIVDNGNQPPIRLVGMGLILLDEIVQTSKTKKGSDSRHLQDFYMKEALSFIEGNYHRDVSIEEIADVCGLSRSYFGRLFKDSFGQSPQQFLINYRMNKAAELLKNSKIPIAEVGRSVSYDNQLHFSRAFKSIFGISPREYRGKHYYGSGNE